MKKIILMGLITLGSLTGSAVSRVGGGKVASEFSQFMMGVEDGSWQIRTASSAGVTAVGPVAFTPDRGPVQQFFDVTEFKDEFPDAVDLSVSDLQTRFAQSNWTMIPGPIPCAVGWQKENSSVMTYIFTWGGGRGFVMKGLNTYATKQVMSATLHTLTIEPGACAWK
jgi:hypothetical protein